ncbi:MAG: RNA methyltransferase [Armatimonadetes bacterium]|nr:RNA methyltransferase [Armatimonadota bacterium]
MDVITSLSNSRIKRLRALRQAKYRRREGLFLVEGLRLVQEALELGAPVETLVYAPELLVSEHGQAMVEKFPPEARLAVSARVFASLSDRDKPQGLLAVVRAQPQSLEAVPLVADLLVLVAWQLRDPGNLGSIIRTADAVGAHAVLVVAPSVDLYDPHCVRATMGSLFALPVVPVPEAEELAPWLERVRGEIADLLVLGTSAHGAKVLFDVNLTRPVVILLGPEQRGLPTPARELADEMAFLPMVGRATSLNVSAAAAVFSYEVLRQRRA